MRTKVVPVAFGLTGRGSNAALAAADDSHRLVVLGRMTHTGEVLEVAPRAPPSGSLRRLTPVPLPER